MKSKIRTIIGLISSLLLVTISIYRILTESLSSTSLFVAYLFAITGLIGLIVYIAMIRKLLANKTNQKYNS
ncbi:putative membrane protein [Lysinibacillus composti]|uniref:Uncharacterized protein n=1 Tax=Lysinibacillus composti TaxID=720633 RepID=A0A3N9UAV7_9BACI|nr:putative membrane protein [Lysinibacillus composti]RQW73633.1 hypothetical protein EBB45_15395 [Lysinibacillus composti]